MGLSSSGTLSPSIYVYNTEVGLDSDTLVDIIESEGVYFVLGWTGSSAYVTTLAPNFTKIETFSLSGIPSQPISLGIMSGIWHVSYVSGTQYEVARFDAEFNLIDTAEAGFVDETSGVFRPRLDRWYSPNGQEAAVLTRSYEPRDTVSLDAEVAPLLWAGDEKLTAVSIYRDVVFEFSLEGEALAAYTLESRAARALNLSRSDSNVFLVEPARIGVISP
jgi:hypothetical protein